SNAGTTRSPDSVGKPAAKTARTASVVMLSALGVSLLLWTALSATLLAWSDVPALGEQPSVPVVVSPEVYPDRTVTFRLYAPKAGEVTLADERSSFPQPLARDDRGVWSVTVGPLEPDVYRYLFYVDDVPTLDPSNARLKLAQSALQNLVEVPS